VETGGAERLVVVEPLEDPVPRDLPVRADEVPEPVDVPELAPA
jgi:hypothetical protein